MSDFGHELTRTGEFALGLGRPSRRRRIVRRIEGNEIGYGMYRDDTCLQAAIATAAQIPIQELPDLMMDQRLAEGESVDEINRASWALMESWLGERGLCMRFHDRVPVSLRRWIGVVGYPTRAPVGAGLTQFMDHCLVMSFNRIVFDPLGPTTPPPGYQARKWRAADVTYGISIHDNKEE